MEKLKQNYFIPMKMLIMSVLLAYGITAVINDTGVSVRMLLLVSLYAGTFALKELFKGRFRIALFFIHFAALALLIFLEGNSFIFSGYLTLYEGISLFENADFRIYFVPLLFSFAGESGQAPVRLIVLLLLSACYIQHNVVVAAYRKLVIEDTINEQNLKQDIIRTEYKARDEKRKSMLMAENQILEERASLSQTLHDKLGHNINGSIYQLEAAKVLMDKDPERTRGIIQGVIDSLRTGMDEIRMILRKERPEKKQLAMLQLYKLCDDCRDKGVETELSSEGDLTLINDEIWEIILDNAFEAISNSLKYSGCTGITIGIMVMNKRVRCTISDNGKGCEKVVDGMGIAGMRRRVREAGGTLVIESEAGFKVNMLLPIE